jgi:hypothetical protein
MKVRDDSVEKSVKQGGGGASQGGGDGRGVLKASRVEVSLENLEMYPLSTLPRLRCLQSTTIGEQSRIFSRNNGARNWTGSRNVHFLKK